MMTPDQARFSALVQKTADCWLWAGAVDRNGYGVFSVGPKKNANGTRRNSMVFAHRFAFELAHGPIPAGVGPSGTYVLHRCHKPGCVNPDHLFLGNAVDSVRHMDAAGRRVNTPQLGEAHGCAKLTAAKVLQIKELLREGVLSQKRIAQIYGVAHSTINHIKTGRLWSHIEEPK